MKDRLLSRWKDKTFYSETRRLSFFPGVNFTAFLAGIIMEVLGALTNNFKDSKVSKLKTVSF